MHRFVENRNLIFFLLVFTCGVNPLAYASEKNDSVSRKLFLSVNVQQGSLLKTHSVYIAHNYYIGLDIRLGIQTDESQKNIFDASYRYPKFGLGYSIGNMNDIILGDESNEGFGKPMALYAFFSSPAYRGNWFLMNYDFGAGIAYRFKNYDPEIRPNNVLIGTKGNGYISVGVDGQWELPYHSTLGIGVAFKHFSNGSFQKPNNGINLLMGTLTYQWGIYNNREKGYSRIPVVPMQPTFEWYVYWGNAVRMLDTDFNMDKPKSSKRWYSTTVSTAALIQTSFRRKFGVGLDLFYFDWGQYIINYRNRTNNLESVKTKITDNLAAGIYLTHEAGYRKLWAITDVGFYLNNRVGDVPVSPWIYERVGIRYRPTDRYFVGLNLKAHLVKADYLELVVGYSLVKN